LHSFGPKSKIHYLGITKKASFKTLLISGVFILLAVPLINWIASLNEQMTLPQAFSGMEAWMQKSEANAKYITEAYVQGTSISILITNLICYSTFSGTKRRNFFFGECYKKC